jgi:hypothetical protein
MSQRYTLRDSRRMATCPACWAMGTKELKYFVLGRLEQPRQNKNLLYRHDKLDEPTKKGPLSFVAPQLPLSSPLLSGPDLEKYEGKQPTFAMFCCGKYSRQDTGGHKEMSPILADQ